MSVTMNTASIYILFSEDNLPTEINDNSQGGEQFDS